MDQGKIGRFIAARRKEQGLTQLQLGEQLGITDRAVSKWETGRAMPDCGLIPDLCAILHISISDLFCGEVVSMENYNETLEKKLLEMAKEKEEADRRWLRLEIIVGLLSMLFLFSMVFTAAFVPMEDWLRVLLIVIGFVAGFIGIFCALRMEQMAGYYACAKCGHRYVPAYQNVLWAMHSGRTRYMKCPHCGQRSWQKKVLNRETEETDG